MAKDASTTEEKHAKPFGEFLRMQNEGRSHDELSEALHDLIESVHETGKGGTITYTIAVTPDKKMSGKVIRVADRIVVKKPALARPESMFYTDKAGNPSREHPDMQPLLDEGLRVVQTDNDETQIRKVDAK